MLKLRRGASNLAVATGITRPLHATVGHLGIGEEDFAGVVIAHW